MTLIGESSPKNSISTKQQLVIYSLAVWVVIMTSRVVAGDWESKFPIVFPDSSSFIKVSNFGPLSSQFWFGERPLLTPLMLWIVGGGIREFVLVQTFLYFTASAILCYVLLRILNSDIARAIAIICILSVVTQSRYALWNSHLLSESLGMSTTLLSISAYLWYSHVRTKRSITLALVASATWMLARDSNTAVTVFIIFSILITLIIHKNRNIQDSSKGFRFGIIALLLIGSFAYIGQSNSGRNDNPVMNNIGQRVLPNPQLLNWYVDRGMPISEALLERTGKNAFDDQWKMLDEPKLVLFREWARESGQFWQMVSFIRFAPHWIDQSISGLDSELAYDYHDYDQFEISQKLPDGSWFGIGGPQSNEALFIWLILAMTSIALLWRSKNRIRANILTVLLLSCFVDYYISWVGDSVEVNRHLVGCFFRTSVILAVVLACAVNTAHSEIRSQDAPNVVS